MGETWPRTDGASFSMETIPFLNDRESECLEETSAMRAGLASSTYGDARFDSAEESREESQIQESLFSCFDFSTSFPYFQCIASPFGMIP